jgi:hypothetical protein
MTPPRDKRLATEEDLPPARGKIINRETVAAAEKAAPEFAETAHDSDIPDAEILESEPSHLFSGETEREFRTQWQEIQTGFVDEPRRSVQHADELITQIMQQLAKSFSEQRSSLERQWEQAENVSTENLRWALKRYRSFFERLLSI